MTEPYAVRVPRGYRVGGWEVREPLATGAFGSVYAARRRTGDNDATASSGAPPGAAPDPGGDGGRGLPGTAALKFLPTGTHTPRRLAHLRELVDREVGLLSRLDSPRLIRLYETLTVDDPSRPELDGAVVLVLERAEDSLSALLRRDAVPAAGPVLLAQVCAGLAQLHGAGWVHGDLKPANVLLMKDGSARLADFNTAAELEGTHAYAPAFSTPDYTPPELLWAEVGERGRRIRPSADVWAFGVLAHLVLTGSFPMPGGTPTARRDAAVAYARGAAELRLSPELPDAWREIVPACLSATHAGRVGTQALLRRVEAAAGTAATPGRPRPRTGRAPRRTAVLAAALATVALAALGYGVSLWGGADGTGGPGDSGGTGVSGGTGGPGGTGVSGGTGGPGGTGGGRSGDSGDSGDRSGGAPTADAAAAQYGAADLRTDRGVPSAYRLLIVETADDCGRPAVTPPLIAAMLKVASDFDPGLSDPARDEYGIARWTPGALRWWENADGSPGGSVPSPPFTPAVSIWAMSRSLCWIAPRLDADLPGDRRVLVAAAFRTSWRAVNKAGGVPPEYRDYAARIAHYLKEYTPPGRT
ncbi:protein kinase domain-containing protein [Streptomyces sp. IBSBF 2806]|uniref:protein kinase domain-containing protein n=1 Tax=Streptomyces sp. IBSBF 2806 TaxID=2903529 RepID=UPI002FDC2B19